MSYVEGDYAEEKAKMLRGELYKAFIPGLIKERARCKIACDRYNAAANVVSRRQKVKLLRDIVGDETSLPPEIPDLEKDDALFEDEPWVHAPIRMDYGTNVRLGTNVYINSNCTILDTCLVTIGSRTLFGPNVSLYSGTHPLDPELRNGTKGPELGQEIHIEEDCWIGGMATILPGVRIGKGSTVGAGSVVTKNVPAYHVVAGNPARIIRKIETKADLDSKIDGKNLAVVGAEKPMAEMAKKLEEGS